MTPEFLAWASSNLTFVILPAFLLLLVAAVISQEIRKREMPETPPESSLVSDLTRRIEKQVEQMRLIEFHLARQRHLAKRPRSSFMRSARSKVR